MTAHEQHPVWRIWAAVGKPPPFEADGTLMPDRGDLGTCVMTGGPARHFYEDALSQSFTLARAASRAFRFGHLNPRLAFSAAATFAAKSIALRAAPWIVEPTKSGDKLTFHCSQACPADERGAGWRAVWEPQKPSGFLPWLLRARPVGTIAAMPLYGMAHGGEVHLGRCVWLAGPPGHQDRRTARPHALHRPSDPLVKLQAKHTAIYAPASTRAGVLALQVDSDAVMEVEVARWRAAIAPAITIMDRLMDAGLTEWAARQTLSHRAADPKQPLRVHTIAATIANVLSPSLTREPFWPVFAGALYV